MRRHFEAPFERELERSGKVNERFVFGRVRAEDPGYVQAMHEWVKRSRAMDPEAKFREAMEIVKRYQPLAPDHGVPMDPVNPTKEFPNHLRRRVTELIGKASHRGVLFWTAVDSMVDTNFGADAVIELKDETINREPPRYVRLDAKLLADPGSVRREQDGRIVIGEIPDRLEMPKDFDNFVASVADAVAQEFQPKVEAGR